MRIYHRPIFGLALALASQANAQAHAPATVLAMASTASLCISITYDKNGNRVLQTVGNVTTSATVWGSATYGCFVWNP
jgi:hypothetical protein